MKRALKFFLPLIFAFQLNHFLEYSDSKIEGDYYLFLPRLLEGLLFFRSQGLSIPHFSISFCGALPFYGNPVSMFYSLPQFLAFALNPWVAVKASTAVILLLGSAATYQVFKEKGFREEVSLAAMSLVASSGFFRARMVFGHLNFQSYLLIPCVIWALTTKRVSSVASVCILSVLGAYFVHSGSHFIIFIAPLAILLFLVFYGFSGLILKRAIFGSAGALLLSAGKLHAVYSHMRLFPRESSLDSVDTWSSAVKLLYSQFLHPGYFEPFKWGAWEYYNEVPELLFPIAAAGALIIWRKSLLALPLVLITVQLSTGYGFFFELLDDAPLVSSLRVNSRLTAVFLFSLIFAACVCLQKIRSSWLCFAVILNCFITPFPRLEKHQPFEIEKLHLLDTALRSAPLEELKVNKVIELKRDDLSAFTVQATNKTCFPINIEREFLSPLKVGGIDSPDDLMDPVCMIYPRENNCEPGDKINSHDRLDKVLSWRNPEFNLSRVGQALNLLSFTSLICILGALMLHPFLTRSEHLKRFAGRLAGSQ